MHTLLIKAQRKALEPESVFLDENVGEPWAFTGVLTGPADLVEDMLDTESKLDVKVIHTETWIERLSPWKSKCLVAVRMKRASPEFKSQVGNIKDC